MAAINDLISQIDNKELRDRILLELEKMNKQKKFGLVFEEHLPESVKLYDVPVKKGAFVMEKAGGKSVYKVLSIADGVTECIDTATHETKSLPFSGIVSVALFGTPIYPYLKPIDSICNAPDSELWHTLIEADNYHALQLLEYMYAGKVDCIYIDPPYNTGARDWKYNNDYVDGNDAYRHSKWLSFIQKRLVIAKKLLNPNDSVLIVTIDEKEYLHLGCLLEQTFPEAEIQMISTVINPKGSSRTGRFSRVDEYIFIIYFGAAKVSPNANEMLREFQPGTIRKVRWGGLMRQGIPGRRSRIPSLFYPIFLDKESGQFHSVGEPLAENEHAEDVVCPNNTIAVLPINTRGQEQQWSLYPPSFVEYYSKGWIKFGRRKVDGSRSLSYLQEGMINKIQSGEITVIGKDKDGTLILEYTDSYGTKKPTTIWHQSLHSASEYGTTLLNSFIGNRFSYPKSLYAVRDTLRFFVDEKPDALILDFFAGSGTTLHAVNLLNAEDNGHRRCIMVTNNELSEEEEERMNAQGFHHGDEAFERLGIARHVTWPRTKCSILGIDINGNPLRGDYPTSLMEVSTKNRSFVKIDYLATNLRFKDKIALCTLIKKNKEVKLPTVTEDSAFVISSDDKYNAAILFDDSQTDLFLEALEGLDNVEFFYIVTTNNRLFNSLKNEISRLLGSIETRNPVVLPMRDGFKANAAFFKLGFLSKSAVALGRQFSELLPVLWMKAGAIGPCPTLKSDNLPDWLILSENKFAVLIDDNQYHAFKQEMEKVSGIDTLYIITDFEREYTIMAEELGIRNTFQLYRDYLDNFRINHSR